MLGVGRQREECTVREGSEGGRAKRAGAQLRPGVSRFHPAYRSATRSIIISVDKTKACGPGLGHENSHQRRDEKAVGKKKKKEANRASGGQLSVWTED